MLKMKCDQGRQRRELDSFDDEAAPPNRGSQGSRRRKGIVDDGLFTYCRLFL
jgi:hypothetical protein